MKNIYKFLSVIIFSSVFGLVSFAHAITPSLSASSTGTGDNVTVTVTGDSNSSIQLLYTSSATGLTSTILGTTSSTGYFSSTISSGTYGIISGSAVYVRVNNQQSTTIAWPTTSYSNNLSLSLTGVVLSAGQSSTITANSTSLQLYNSTNSQVASISISGNQITITGNTTGSTVATICLQGSTTSCSNVSIVVQNSSATAISFSQSNVTIYSGQSANVTVSGGTGTYLINNNSNSSLVQASISGNNLVFSTSSSTTGSSSVTICSTNLSSCGIVVVNVGISASLSSLYFSQNSPIISVGQSTTVVISGGGSSVYYVSSNSNTSVVQTMVSGSNLTLTGVASGSAIVYVCSSSGICNSLTVTVNYISSGGSISLSQSTVSLVVGQTYSITISGGDAPYNLPSNGGSVFNATLSSNTITIYGLSSGSSTIPVCSAGGGCVNLNVTVSGSGSILVPILSQSTLSLAAGQTRTVTISNSGSFYISSNSNQSAASASISGNIITISALNIGTSNITICQSGGQCTTLVVTVSSSSTSSTTVSSTNFLSFSQASPTVGIYKTSSVSIFGGSGSYSVVYNSNPSISTLTISGSSISIYGLSNGTSIIVLCSSSGNACGAISLTVSQSSSISSVKLSSSSVSLKAGKYAIISISGGSGTYSIQSNSNSAVASIVTIRNSALIVGRKAGTAVISICSSGQCASLTVVVSASTTASQYRFTNALTYGDSGIEVTELQKRLFSEGYYKGSITGDFDALTLSAVRAYQGAKGIRQTGNVGEQTMAALNN